MMQQGEVQVALALVNEHIYVLSPLEESGSTGETVYKADLMMNYTFTEFEALDPVILPITQNQVNPLQY
jgi:hypothetical protein